MRVGSVDRSAHPLTRCPISSSGMPNTAASITFGVGDQHVLRLLRVDVHPAGDDHVVTPVGQVEEPSSSRYPMSPTVFQLCLSRDVGRLLRVVEVLKSKPPLRSRSPRPDLAAARCRPRRGCAVGSSSIGRPDPGCASHSSAVISVEPMASEERVVLVDDRSPPVDQLLLDLNRAWRRCVHHPLQAG